MFLLRLGLRPCRFFIARVGPGCEAFLGGRVFDLPRRRRRQETCHVPARRRERKDLVAARSEGSDEIRLETRDQTLSLVLHAGHCNGGSPFRKGGREKKFHFSLDRFGRALRARSRSRETGRQKELGAALGHHSSVDLRSHLSESNAHERIPGDKNTRAIKGARSHEQKTSSISDDELLRRLSDFLRQSRRVESDLVAHIGEVDERRLYAREGSPSMFHYCTAVLNLSEAEDVLAHFRRARLPEPPCHPGDAR